MVLRPRRWLEEHLTPSGTTASRQGPQLRLGSPSCPPLTPSSGKASRPLTARPRHVPRCHLHPDSDFSVRPGPHSAGLCGGAWPISTVRGRCGDAHPGLQAWADRVQVLLAVLCPRSPGLSTGQMPGQPGVEEHSTGQHWLLLLSSGQGQGWETTPVSAAD